MRTEARRTVGGRAAILLAVALCPVPASAQEGPSTIEFSFSNPGARSLGFGGAFAALADDATSAFANPAGLVQLTRPELSIEGRFWGYSTPFVEGGRISGEPSGLGLDITAGVRTATSERDLSGVSFISYVYPQGQWSLAAYRHVLARFEATRATQGFFQDPPTSPRADDFRSRIDLEIVSFGVAAAYRLREHLSFGAGLSYSNTDGELRNERFAPLELTLPDGPYGKNSYDPAALTTESTLSFEGGDLGFSVGFLWRTSPHWSVGGFYRLAPDLDLVIEEETSDFGPRRLTDRMALPDVCGLGAAFRSAAGNLTISLEWDRVEYSTIISSLDPELAGTEDIVLDDGDELRIGVEYAFIERRPLLALRAGAWLDPAHRIRFEGDDPLTRAAFPGGEDEIHVAGGVGVAFDRFQIDLGVDLSDAVDTAALSAIFTF